MIAPTLRAYRPQTARAVTPEPQALTLLAYQQEGLTFLRQKLGHVSGHGDMRGALLADEMGLGKTVQAVAFIDDLVAVEQAGGRSKEQWPLQVLILCPKSLALNWQRELDKWMESTFMTARVTVLPYSQVKKALDGGLFNGSLDLLICDEAHYLKNPDSKRAELVSRIEAHRKLYMTGTPMPNRPKELWPLLSTLQPGEWGTFKQYAELYCDPKLKTISTRPIRVPGGYPARFKQAWDYSGSSNLDDLHAKLTHPETGVMLRRLKQDVLKELPPKRRMLVPIEHGFCDDDLLAQLMGDCPRLTAQNYDAAVQRLVADKVLFTEWAKRRKEQGEAKVPFVLEHLENALEHDGKIIVFAHHRGVGESLRAGLVDLLGPKGVCEVWGKHTPHERDQAVQRFQNDPECRVFVGGIAAAGVGLTLTASAHVVFAELDPTPGVMNQCEDRAHRVTQKESVLVQYILTDRSLDARIAQILVQKQEQITRGIDGGRRA